MQDYSSHQSLNSNSKTTIEDFKFLYSVDQLAQSTFFEKLFESYQTLLPKDDLLLMDYSISLQIYKNYWSR
jgi:hypothetical protein